MEFDPDKFPLDLTLRDHLRYQFVNDLGTYNPSSLFLVKIDPCSRQPETPLEEAIRSARQIRDSTTMPIVLCMSGGVDSEATALAFRAAGINFKVVILVFHDNLNWFDVSHAVNFCEGHRIPYDVIDFDVLSFLSSGKYLDHVHKYRNRSPQFAVHFELLERIDGLPVMPWQPLHVFRDLDQKAWFGLPEDHYFAYARYFAVNRRHGVPYFFLYSPELIFSFLRTVAMQKEIFEGARTEAYELKCRAYLDGGFQVVPKKRKYTGFEMVKAKLQEIYGSSEPIFENLYRRPIEALYPMPIRINYIFPMGYLRASPSGS